MESEPRVNQLDLLKTVTYSYREFWRGYRNDHGILDSDLWFRDMQVDYALEIILANFNFVNLICERLIEEPISLPDPEDEDLGPEMADYDMGYSLAEDCTEIVFFAKENDEEVRLSLTLELFYAHIQYFNLSNTCGRRGWFDVNKRLLSSMVRLIQLEPQLVDLLDQWDAYTEEIDSEDSEDDTSSDHTKWKKHFIEEIREYTDKE